MSEKSQRYTKTAVWLHWITAVLMILHVLAALKHQFWDRDGLLMRMSPR